MAGGKWLRRSAFFLVFSLLSVAAMATPCTTNPTADTYTCVETLPAANVPLGSTVSSSIPVPAFNTNLGTLESTSVSIDTTFTYGGSVTINSPISTSGSIQLSGTIATYDLTNYGLFQTPVTVSTGAFVSCPCSPTTFGDSGSVTKTGSAASSATVPPLTGGNIPYTYTFKNTASGPVSVNLTNTVGATVTVTDTYAPVPKIVPPTVYLDFANNSQAEYRLGDYSTVYNKVVADVEFPESVTASVQQIYGKYLINFTDTQPTTGPYFTVYIGNTADSIRSIVPSNIAASLPSGTVGQSAFGDPQLTQPYPSAEVFSDESFFSEGYSALCLVTNECSSDADERLAQVIGHEVGHMLGLSHVDDPTQLMFPDPATAGYGTPEIIGGPAVASGQTNKSLSNPKLILEDSNAILGCVLGFSATDTKDCSSVASQGLYYADGSGNVVLHTSTNSIFSEPIFDAKLLVSQDNETDSGPFEYYIGTILPGYDSSIPLPLLGNDSIIIEGSLSEGGPISTFSGFYDSAQQSLIVTDSVETSVPEPSSLLVFSLSVVCLIYSRKRLKRH